MSLYYFIASLPLLKWGDPPRIRLADFLAACDDQLPAVSARIARTLAAGALPPGDAPHFLRAWRNAENQFRNAVARQRAARRHVDISRDLRPTGLIDLALESGVKDGFARATPLEREQALDRVRWDKAGELAGCDTFSLAALLAYAVRLNIAHRWAALDPASGREAARQLIEQEIGDT